MNFFTILARGYQGDVPGIERKPLYTDPVFRTFMQIGLITMAIIMTSVQLFSATTAKSQTLEEVEVKLELKGESLVKAFHLIEKQSSFIFMYRKENIKNIRDLQIPASKKTIAEFLETMLANTSLSYKQLDNRILITPRDKEDAGFSEVKEALEKQAITVRGQVSDASGNALAGVSVVVKGSSSGTATDANGNYSINVPNSEAILTFTYVGFISQEIAVGNRTTINVSLQAEQQTLNEVVVTALGIERETKSLTYSSQSVSTEELSEARSLNVVNSLQGKVAGMTISTAGTGLGGGSRVILRGNRSLTGDSQPLYVIDGVPVSQGLTNMSPDNIASINVLKGPSAAALYGSAAQNGAIIIETKRGQEGVTNISLNNTFLVGSPIHYLEVQNVYGQGVSGIYNRTSEESWGPKMEGQEVSHWSNDPALSGTMIPFNPQPNNINDVFHNSFSMSNNIIATTGNKNTQTAFSYTRETAHGIIENNDLARNDISLRITNKLTDWLSMDAKINYIQQSLDNPNTTGDDAFFNPYRNIYRMPRNIRIEDLRQFQYIDISGNIRQNYWNPGSTSGKNPYWIMNRLLTFEEEKRVIGLLSLKVDLTKDLNLIVRTSYDGATNGNERKVWKDTYGSTYDFGYYRVIKGQSEQWNSDALLSYKKDISPDLNVTALVGGSLRKTGGEGSLSANTTQQLIVPNFFSLSNTQIPAASFAPSAETETQSLYFSGNFGWKDAIFLDVTGRNDWSSTLPADSRSYFYPSLGISAVLTDIIPALSGVLSYAKARASWAMVGSSAPPYSLSRAVTLSSGGNNGFLTLGGTLPNEDLKPERTESTEIGLDLRFLDNRLGLDITAYKSNTYDQLFTVALPVGSGASAFFTNGGDVENKGIEAIVRATPIQGDLVWDISTNFAMNRNWVNEISDERPYLIVGGDTYMRDFVVEQGKEFGNIYSRGWQRDEQGRVIVGVNGIPLISPGKTVKVANFNPDWLGGISNSFSYKNFSVGFLIEHRQGGTIVSSTDGVLYGEGVSKETLQGREGGLVFGQNLFAHEEAVLADGSPNTIAISSQDFWRTVGGRNTPVGEAFVQDATNTRLREVTLGYTFPKSMLKGLPLISSIKVSLVGRNLFFIQRSGNWDPEILTGTTPASEGFQAYVPPTERTFGFNLKIDF